MKTRSTDSSDSLFLALAGRDLTSAISLAACFRAAVQNLWVPQSLCVAHGSELVRAVTRTSNFRVLLDARVVGNEQEVTDAILAADAAGVWGLTVCADFLTKGLKAVVEDTSVKVVASLAPFPSSELLWRDSRKTLRSYGAHVALLQRSALAAGCHGMHLPARYPGVVGDLATFVDCDACPGAPGLSPEYLTEAGVTHPVFNPATCGCRDFDMTASKLVAAQRRREPPPAMSRLKLKAK